jgi:hypothetical protein
VLMQRSPGRRSVNLTLLQGRIFRAAMLLKF